MQLLILLFPIVYMLFIYPKLYNKMFKNDLTSLSEQIANVGTNKTMEIVPLCRQTNGFYSLIVLLPQAYVGKTVTVTSIQIVGDSTSTEYLSDFNIQGSLNSGYFSAYTSSPNHTTIGILYFIFYTIS